MTRGYWSQVKAGGLAVPEDRPLADLTTELTTMLGSPDPHMRDGLAYPTLATWVDRGVYDDLITGLGDGMARRPHRRARRAATPTRSSGARSRCWCWPSASTATNSEDLLPARKVLEWGDRIASWYLREQRPARLRARQGLGARRRPRRRRHRRAGALAPPRPQRAHGAPRRHRRPRAGAGRRAVRSTASPTGWRWRR